MEAAEHKFPCERCGACCLILGCRSLARDKGGLYLCTEYESRPLVCNLTDIYETLLAPDGVSWEFFVEYSRRACLQCRELVEQRNGSAHQEDDMPEYSQTNIDAYNLRLKGFTYRQICDVFGWKRRGTAMQHVLRGERIVKRRKMVDSDPVLAAVHGKNQMCCMMMCTFVESCKDYRPDVDWWLQNGHRLKVYFPRGKKIMKLTLSALADLRAINEGFSFARQVKKSPGKKMGWMA